MAKNKKSSGARSDKFTYNNPMSKILFKNVHICYFIDQLTASMNDIQYTEENMQGLGYTVHYSVQRKIQGTGYTVQYIKENTGTGIYSIQRKIQGPGYTVIEETTVTRDIQYIV